MLILTYFLAILIGLSLGLIGGGGSILTVPILVYITGIDPVLATSYSLLIVGSASAIAAFQKSRQQLIDYKKAIYFGLPSIISVTLTRTFLLPSIPETIIELKGFIISKDIFIMIFFSIIMLLASISMIINKKELLNKSNDINYTKIISLGFLVGLIAGFVGAGGGFLIVPALVNFTGLEVKKAIGTSLLIIATNSLFGFIGDFMVGVDLDYKFVAIFIAISVIGIYLGNLISKSISGTNLKKGFGIFIILMAVFIILKETNIIL